MAISDLTNTTWKLNPEVVWNYNTFYVNITFESTNYTAFIFDNYELPPPVSAFVYEIRFDGSSTYVVSSYGNSGIMPTNEETFTITGGTDVADSTLIAWLEDNATQIVPEPTTWKLKSHITDTVPGSGDYLQLYFIYYCELTAADMSDLSPLVSNEIISPFSTWQELVTQLPGALEELGATNVTSTLNASSVSADYKTKWSTADCGFYGNSEDGYWFGPNGGWTTTEYPDITGTISFTFDGDSYNLTFTQLLETMFEVIHFPIFDDFTWMYDREIGYACEGMRTITITGGTDAEDADLVAWLQANAVEVVPFTEGVRVTYNGDVIKQLDTDGTFALSCANKIMTSNITIETIGVGSISATYDGDTIINSSGNHTYQLPCGGKIADTDIVITITMTVIPDNLLITSEGNYIVDVNDGYLITAPPTSGNN